MLYRQSVRTQLTFWYVAAMIVVLAVYALTVYAFVNRSVSQSLDEVLGSDFTWAAEMWDQRPDGTLTWFDGGGESSDDPWLQVWSPDGELLYQSARAQRHPIAESGTMIARRDRGIIPVAIEGASFRLLTRPARIHGKDVVIQVARSEVPMRGELGELTFILLIGLPFGAAAAGIGGYTLARRALAPVDHMAARARTITAERLSDRLPVENPNDELGRLAGVFNETLARLESSFVQMERFTADVSHELRTPLTAIRSVGEVGLREHRTDAEYRGIIGSMLEEADRLACLVDTLLAVSRAGSGSARLTRETVDLGGMAQEVAGHLRVLAEDKGQSISVECAGDARCEGDRVILRQALINLVDNAIKYSPAAGDIRIRVSTAAGKAVLEVSDTGPGIPEERRVRIFDRYSRGAASPGGGAGLGLAIARWAVEANRGELSLEPTAGTGSTFRITFPARHAA